MSQKWDPYKEEILRLYIVENLTVDQVMGHMLQTYGFDQKKPHYEYRLKLWGARKNVKKEVLEYISHEDRKRRPPQDMSSGAYVVDGILLSGSRFKRARRRHDFNMSLARKYGKALSPKLPPGHIVRKTSPPAPAIAVDWPKHLPWLRFEERFNIVVPQSSTFIQILARAAHSHGLISGMGIGGSSDLARAIYAASRETQSSAADLMRMLPCIPNGSHSSMISIGPSIPNDVATKILKAFLFQVSNNLGQHRSPGWGKDLLLLFQKLDEADPMILSHLNDSRDPTSEAILEKLYEAAIKYSATALIYRFWKAGRDLNALLSIGWEWGREVERGKSLFLDHEDSRSLTALQFAASTCNLQLATTLIDAGAKADLGVPTPLQILCSRSNIWHPDTLPFAHLLISHGAQLNTRSDQWVLTPLEGAVLDRNRSLVSFLLQRGATDVLCWPKGLIYYLRYYVLDTETCDFVFPGKSDVGAPTSALQLAIMTGDDSITKMLFSTVMKQEDRRTELLEEALLTACVAGEQGIANVILKNLDFQPEGSGDLINSAFFATAWDTNCRIAQLLVEHNAVRRKLQNSCLAIFQAAALYGNTSLVNLLHSAGFDINSGASLQFGLSTKRFSREPPPKPPSMTSTPLGCAIWMGHKDVIETLFNFGADTIGIDLITAIRTRLQGLITRVLNQCDNINEICEGESALDVAIQECLGLILIRKLIDAGATLRGYELVDAVRSNDQEVVDFFLPSCDIVAGNSKYEDVLEAACCAGNFDMALQYFDCEGIYGSRALFLAVSRAVKIHDYRFVDLIVANRPRGPISIFEASALCLSIRAENTTLTNMLLHDDFESSTKLSVYCGSTWDFSDSRTELEAEIYPLDYENSSTDIKGMVDKPRRSHSNSDGGPIEFLSPLLVAAFMGQEQTVRKMVEHGYLPDPCLFDILYKASCIGTRNRNMIISAYASQVSKVTDQIWHQSMLINAIKHGIDLGLIQQHITKLRSLDYRWRDPDLRNPHDNKLTPLSIAVLSGSCDHVRAVLEAGATPSARKWRPAAKAFLTAVGMGSLDLVSLLLNGGADINDVQHRGFAAAMRNKDFGMAVFLLERGLDINAPLSFSERHSGRTCLESASENGSIDAVDMLFSRGVIVQGRVRIHFVRSVMLATSRCHYAMAKLLKQRGSWTHEDDELAKLPRATDLNHCCPRFVYDDPTFRRCRQCGTGADSPYTSESSEGEEDVTSSPGSYEDVDEQSFSEEMNTPVGGMSTSEIEPECNYYQQTTEVLGWPFIHDQQDGELDISWWNIDSESNSYQQTTEMLGWPLDPYEQQDWELDMTMEDSHLDENMIP